MATKHENFEAVLGVLEGIEGTDELTEFVKAQLALLDKRASKGRGMTATQKENEVLKEGIVIALTDVEDDTTATDLAKVLDVSVQKVSQLLRQLVTDKLVARTEAKGKEKAKFAVA